MAIATCGGCGRNNNLGTVAGKVTYHGEPLNTAQIEFHPTDRGKKSIGFTDSSGNYELQYTLNEPGAIVGRHKVRVIVMPAPGSPPITIPPEYGSNSKLECDVRPGSNRFDIEISK
jgi:hypothetical protein